MLEEKLLVLLSDSSFSLILGNTVSYITVVTYQSHASEQTIFRRYLQPKHFLKGKTPLRALAFCPRTIEGRTFTVALGV